MHLVFSKLGIPHGFLNWLQYSTEQICVQLFEAGPGDASVVVYTLKQGINFDVSLSGPRNRSAFNSSKR